MHRQKGFTLIELLVVIAIIGLLSTIVMVSLNVARAKARDAQRLENAYQLQTALRAYFIDNDTFPVCGGWEGSGFTVRSTDDNWTGCLTTKLAPYINRLPIDPINANKNGLSLYYYYHCPANSSSDTICGTTSGSGAYINIYFETRTPNLLALTINP